jgi:hypothetical protein
VHRAANGVSSAAAAQLSAAQPSRGVDAGADADDFGAAVEMLTKAKAVETLP